MLKKGLALFLSSILLIAALSGCGNSKDDSSQPVAEPVTLTIVGAWEDCKAVQEAGRMFTAKYSNCTVKYEYLQDFDTAVEKRMAGTDMADLFFASNLQKDSPMLPYALELNSCEGLDLSNTFPGLINNFTYRDDSSATAKLYSIPLGAEMRGLYINKTLLDKCGIAIPTNQESLLAACAALKEKGYIPFHGNPGDFSQTLLYPWVCNIIANNADYQEVYNKVNSRQDGISELFREPFEFLYKLVENRYYDYKTAQADDLFTESRSEDYARYFFNIKKDGENYTKVDDIGVVAFMPSAMSLQSIIQKTKEDYHSEIEYVFVPAPVGKDGGYAYLSPARGIAANKNSPNVEWSVKFLDFLFQKENNEVFAKNFNAIPNTKEAFAYIENLYDIPETNISELGQVTFGYDFYSIIFTALVETSKGNNPKYMKNETELYPLEYYMSNLEASFKEK